jgi:hypothetical protein
MGELKAFKPKKTEPKSAPLPDKIYAVRFTTEDGDEDIIAFEDIESIHDGELVGVYELSDVRRKREIHSLV